MPWKKYEKIHLMGELFVLWNGCRDCEDEPESTYCELIANPPET